VQVFGRQADQIAQFGLTAALVMLLVFAVAWVGLDRSSYGTGQRLARLQPIPFSHAHHAGEDGIDCRYCHGAVETSSSAGLPATEICMTCHSQLFADAPVLEPVRQSFASGKPIVWERVHDLPDFVYFNHAAHVNNGVGCVSCHGRIDEMPTLYQAAPLTMQWCLDCHRDPGPQLRPEDEITSMTWTPTGERRKFGEQMIAHYHVRTDHMTDCYVCHR